jgi:hypothetical protein
MRDGPHPFHPEFVMARLMVIPHKHQDHAVLIIARDGDATVMGYVAVSILGARLKHPLSACEGLAVVERNLPAFEKTLIRKSNEVVFIDTSIACVEIDAADVANISIAELRQS